MPTLAKLNSAASEVIIILKGIPEYSNARVAVISGLALWNYLQNGRTTKDVDLIISIDTAPDSMKQRLLSLPNTRFVTQAQVAEAQALSQIPAGHVPFISQIDLLIFKINSYGLRAQIAKKRIDARDAQNLLQNMTTPLRLTAAQLAIVELCLSDIVSQGTKTQEWWKQRLGLVAQNPTLAADEYWTWSPKDCNYYHLNSDRSYEWAAQAGSLNGQQSSSSRSRDH
ncbi:uncharacterized protein RSE6_14971 [Rhynchosporium secalis]|uniref:Uncharacterized protein n=1 Tax=Rhynchosporium secalis TaxID=38038 RepID=A0A1E1MWG3_RHYSE|nr:uncharacterized protein RSE6_14971 [Rhynchosporium secalis]